MTPKEKAAELHNKILNITYDDRDMPDEPTWVSTQCALIAVDNIILANPHSNPFNTDVYSTMEYWLEVKQEIEKL